MTMTALHSPDRYLEGWALGSVQIDPEDEALEAAIDVLTTHLSPTERHQWADGFKDAIRHSQRSASLPK